MQGSRSEMFQKSSKANRQYDDGTGKRSSYHKKNNNQYKSQMKKSKFDE